MDIKEKVISQILERMVNHLTNEQVDMLNNALTTELHDFDIKPKSNEIIKYDNSSEYLLKKFIMNKKLAGCSKDTIKKYNFYLQKLILNLKKPLNEVTTDDMRFFLASYKEYRKISNSTLDGMRLCFSSFFTWLHDEGLIDKNPVKRISRIKSNQVVKTPFSDEDLEMLRMNCKRERDLAIMEFLYSSGVRISEAVNLNRDQIDFIKKDCIVFGKGSKERIVYLNSKSCIHLRNYLSSRVDNNPALFVSLKKPYNRLSKEAIETIFRNLGRKAGVPKTHPHRFRRTLATNALNRGMPLQEVKELLGHVKTDTTMLYCTVLQENIRLSHKKYIA